MINNNPPPNKSPIQEGQQQDDINKFFISGICGTCRANFDDIRNVFFNSRFLNERGMSSNSFRNEENQKQVSVVTPRITNGSDCIKADKGVALQFIIQISLMCFDRLF